MCIREVQVSKHFSSSVDGHGHAEATIHLITDADMSRWGGQLSAARCAYSPLNVDYTFKFRLHSHHVWYLCAQHYCSNWDEVVSSLTEHPLWSKVLCSDMFLVWLDTNHPLTFVCHMTAGHADRTSLMCVLLVIAVIGKSQSQLWFKVQFEHIWRFDLNTKDSIKRSPCLKFLQIKTKQLLARLTASFPGQPG